MKHTTMPKGIIMKNSEICLGVVVLLYLQFIYWVPVKLITRYYDRRSKLQRIKKKSTPGKLRILQ